MIDTRAWAMQRRMLVIVAFFAVLIALMILGYFRYIYIVPNCFDGLKNGSEAGLDCGGECLRICAFTMQEPRVDWVKSFKVVDGQYNAVAYVENPNQNGAAPQLNYTITLEDNNGVIVERKGSTVLPADNIYPIFEGRILTGGRIPTKTNITFQKPDLWLPSTKARQQFTLIDRGEIKNADSAPRLQSSLRNNSLLPAENVEIVVTIYDRLGSPVTASRTFVDLEPQTVSDVIFTWPEPIATTVRSCEVPTDVILAIDLSGSMNNLGGVPVEPLASVKRAAEAFVSRLGVRDRVGVVTFATNGELKVKLSTSPASVSQLIAQLNILPEEENGSTNSGEAFRLAFNEFNSDRHSPDARKVLILLTDGLTNAPEPEPETYAYQQAKNLKDDQVQIYTIGLGEEINEDFLRTIASDGEKVFRTLSPEQIDRIYRNITDAICEEGPARVDIIPKSDIDFPKWP
jgi:Mg-chelatase subunit ChlD